MQTLNLGVGLLLYEPARNFFKSIDSDAIKKYSDYWESIAPKNDFEIFQRYLFAFCSVHTTFQGNVNAYLAIKDYNNWADKPDVLLDLLKNSKAGLHNNRSKYIMDFTKIYWADPKRFKFTSKKNHVSKRDEIADRVSGLGLAKVSFALEMTHPNSARVLCGDVHQLRFYGIENCRYKTAAEKKQYRLMENHWITLSSKTGVSPYVARCIFWDKLQNKQDSRYWSFTLES